MKAGRIILALIFLLIFLLSGLVAVDAIRSVNYQSVFPDDVNAVVVVHRPLDVPLKVLNSSPMKNFFATEHGKEIQSKLDEVLAGLGAGPKKEPPVLYYESIEGIKVYYPETVKPTETGSEAAEESAVESESEEEITEEALPPTEGEDEITTPEKAVEEQIEKVTEQKTKSKKGGLTRAKLQQALGIGGAIVKDLYIGLYGNPMELIMTQKPKFMFAMNLGRLSIFPRLILPSFAKKLPQGRVPGKDETLPVAFAFVRNLIVAGDPEGVKRMIYTLKNKPMKVETVNEPMETETGEITTPEKKIETVKLRPLKASAAWQKVKPSINPKATYNFVLLVPNLLNQLKSDPSMHEILESNAEKFGLFRILGFVHSNQMDKTGLQITNEVVFDPPTPLLKLLNQQEREMSWPALLPDSFTIGGGITADSFPELWESAVVLGSLTSAIQDDVVKRFGMDDFKAFLGILGKEISIFQFTDTEGGTHTIHCDSLSAGANDYFAKLENVVAESAVAQAESAISSAREGGAEEFAPEAMAKATEILQNARTELEEGRKVSAVVHARKAKEIADYALRFIFKKAENAIEAAGEVGAFTHASEQYDAAKTALEEARNAYEQGQWSAGTAASKNALRLAKFAFSFGKAGSAIENAKLADAETKSAQLFATAQTAFNMARSLYAQGMIDEAIAQAELAASRAKKAKATATGGEAEEYEPTIEEPPAIDYSVSDVQSPRVVANAEVFRSVGVAPVDYVFMDQGTMCYGIPEDMDIYLKTPRGGALKKTEMMELLALIPRETQALILLNPKSLLSGMEVVPEEGDVANFVKGLNLTVGAYAISKDNTVRVTTVSPVKLFDGSTSSGARGVIVVLFFLAKWLFYIIGIVCLYLAVRTLTSAKKSGVS